MTHRSSGDIIRFSETQKEIQIPQVFYVFWKEEAPQETNGHKPAAWSLERVFYADAVQYKIFLQRYILGFL